MFYFPWSAIAWLEFWTEMNRAWLVPPVAAANDPRIVPFPTARARARSAISRASGAHIVRLSV